VLHPHEGSTPGQHGQSVALREQQSRADSLSRELEERVWPLDSALGMLAGLPDVVRRYFELDPRDVDRFVALFSDEAIVVGETVDLRCDFAVTSDLISRLVIAP
jgi:hypothetical protein